MSPDANSDYTIIVGTDLTMFAQNINVNKSIRPLCHDNVITSNAAISHRDLPRSQDYRYTHSDTSRL